MKNKVAKKPTKKSRSAEGCALTDAPRANNLKKGKANKKGY